MSPLPGNGGNRRWQTMSLFHGAPRAARETCQPGMTARAVKGCLDVSDCAAGDLVPLSHHPRTDPGVLFGSQKEDARIKSGHDELREPNSILGSSSCLRNLATHRSLPPSAGESGSGPIRDQPGCATCRVQLASVSWDERLLIASAVDPDAGHCGTGKASTRRTTKPAPIGQTGNALEPRLTRRQPAAVPVTAVPSWLASLRPSWLPSWRLSSEWRPPP